MENNTLGVIYKVILSSRGTIIKFYSKDFIKLEDICFINYDGKEIYFEVIELETTEKYEDLIITLKNIGRKDKDTDIRKFINYYIMHLTDEEKIKQIKIKNCYC